MTAAGLAAPRLTTLVSPRAWRACTAPMPKLAMPPDAPHASAGRSPAPAAAPRWRRAVVLAVMAAAVASASLLAFAHAHAAGVGTAPAVREAAPSPAHAASANGRGMARHPALGVTHTGLASYYAHRFAGRLMADGTPMKPESDNAASRTLPIGTVAQVTNLTNGRTTIVTIRDRGPYTGNRIIDVSPSTAKVLGFLREGVTKVEVLPLHIPGARKAAHLAAEAASAARAAFRAAEATLLDEPAEATPAD